MTQRRRPTSWFDVGRHLTWLFSYPLGRYLDSSRAELLASVSDPVEDWDGYVDNHLQRSMSWGTAALASMALAFLTDVVIPKSSPGWLTALPGAFATGFGVCALTALLHGLAVLFANRRSRRGAPLPRGVAALLVRPGNLYPLVVVCVVVPFVLAGTSD